MTIAEKRNGVSNKNTGLSTLERLKRKKRRMYDNSFLDRDREIEYSSVETMRQKEYAFGFRSGR